MVAVLLASGSPLNDRFDPAAAVGKKVRLRILLDWDLRIPDGIIRRTITLVPRREQIAYLVELESELIVETHEKGFFIKRKPLKKTGTRYLVVAIRRTEAAGEELHGHVLSELTAPLFYYPRKPELVSRSELKSKEDLSLMGPGQIEIVGIAENRNKVGLAGR